MRSFADYVREKFGRKVYKIPVDAGFTCPNIDGEVGRGGCIYCRNDAFQPPYVDKNISIEEQVEAGKKIFRRKNAEKFLVYFQAHTNTYGPVEELKEFYERALVLDDVLGLCIGTRPDCLPEEVIDLLGAYSAAGREIWVEIGQQTANERTLARINRGHGFSDYQEALGRLKEYPGLNVCAHLIFGLPGEDLVDMEKSVREINRYKLEGIKFHHLQVVRGTPLARRYRAGEYSPLSYEEYVEIVKRALDILPDKTVIHRLIGDAPRRLLLAPRWEVSKQKFVKDLGK